MQTSLRVAFGLLLNVKTNATELVASVAPSAGDGGRNVIIGLFGSAAAKESGATTPTSTAATTVTSSGLRTRLHIPLPSPQRSRDTDGGECDQALHSYPPVPGWKLTLRSNFSISQYLTLIPSRESIRDTVAGGVASGAHREGSSRSFPGPPIPGPESLGEPQSRSKSFYAATALTRLLAHSATRKNGI